MTTPPKITFRKPTDHSDPTIVYADDDRLGFVRQIGPATWAATDTYLVGLRGTYSTRARAVAALLRRKAKES